MKKKIASHKATPQKAKKVVSHSGFWQYLTRYFLSVISVWLLISVASAAFPKLQQAYCANSISCINDLSVRVENNAVGLFNGQKVVPPAINLAQDNQKPNVLGAAFPSGPKHIIVDLTTQTLYAYQGSTLIMKTLISSGKWHPTPLGDFHIWVKLRATRMSGGSGDDAYDLPNVPYTMFFYNDQVGKGEGFSLHGAYWHDNFGHAMSHGCINMRIVDAQALYNWADPPTTATTTYASDQNPGTLVTIMESGATSSN